MSKISLFLDVLMLDKETRYLVYTGTRAQLAIEYTAKSLIAFKLPLGTMSNTLNAGYF